MDDGHPNGNERDARTRAELALRSSELSYRRLFEAAQDGILILDADTGRINDVNPFLMNLLGFSHHEMVGQTVGELSPFKDVVSNQIMLERLQRDGYIRYEDLPLETRDGRKIAVEFVCNVYQAGDKKVIQCNIRDITARKRSEEVLRESRQVIEGIINAIPVRVFWKNKQLVYLGCNAAFARDAGFADSKDVIGKDDYQMRWAELAEIYRGHDRQVIESGRPKLLIEDTQTNTEGQTVTLLSSKVPLRDSKGEINGVVGTYMDITERKRAEATQALLATAVEQAAETIVITNTDGTIIYANPAFEKTTGYARAEALSQNPHLLWSGQQDAEFYRRMWDCLGRGEIWQGHFVSRRKDGAIYEEEAIISPVRDAAGKVVNYVACKRDVTREMQLEGQFRQAQKMEAIGQLAGGVAHDFNNILTVIQMRCDFLKAGNLSSAAQMECAGEIAAATQRAATLTRQLLLFSRKQTLRLRDMDLNQSINNMTKMLRRILGEDIQMQFKFAHEPLFLHADSGMLDQVLMNLAVNSRYAMPKGGLLSIETSAVDFDESVRAQSIQASPGSYVCLSVSDTGCGIPPEILPRIFEPFFTTKEDGKGTGLGLATVFGIIQQHRGWINVYSELGHGTTFRIYLPRLARKPRPESKPPEVPIISGGGETILIVEDDPSLLAAAHKTLLQYGYRVVTAGDGVEALAAWKQNPGGIHLLLTDVVLPGGMSGKDLSERLLRENPKLKVVYTSGHSAEVAADGLPLEEGVNFLGKPFQTGKLAQTVRRTLDAST